MESQKVGHNSCEAAGGGKRRARGYKLVRKRSLIIDVKKK